MNPKLRLLYKFKDHNGHWHEPGEIWEVSYADGSAGFIFIAHLGAYDAALINMITRRLDRGL